MDIKQAAVLWSLILMLSTSSLGNKICYGELGCLVTDEGWHSIAHRPFNPTPYRREEIGTVFKLFSRHKRHGVVFSPNNIGGNSLRVFNPTKNTKIIIHGFRSNADSVWVTNMTNVFLERDDLNVITVNWANGAGSLYVKAVSNARVVGLEVAFLINKLIENHNANPGTFHIIGHSLGAHIAGYAGSRVDGLGRITGLDPAGLGFTRMPSYVRLDRLDAEFVDIIHTDAEFVGLGLVEAVGDVDFFPNGGYHQKGCRWPMIRKWSAILKLRFLFENLLPCSHTRSQELFIESIKSSPYLNTEGRSTSNSCHLVGFLCHTYEDFVNGQCTSCGNDGLGCALMGIDADKYPGKRKRNGPRKFYLVTNSSPPYCGHHYAMNVTVAAYPRESDAASGDIIAAINGRDGSVSTAHFTPKLRTMKPGETHTILGFSDVDIRQVYAARVTWSWKPNTLLKYFCLSCIQNLLVSHLSVTNMEYNSNSIVETKAACTTWKTPIYLASDKPRDVLLVC
ncbi:inactive pancreatic lipase-related protein 1-like isoform X2 [Ischnura elegans]|nr:inactive pancreatic lipase-related protein 1-like isoform X2 [Ischnura elegans]